MLGTIRDRFGRIRAGLTSLDSQPLGKATLIIIVFLDIFILTSIFDGLDKHTRQLSSPDEYIPATCREIVINRDWNPTNRIDNLSAVVLASDKSYYRLPERTRDHHSVCGPYLDLLDRIKNNKVLIALFDDRDKFRREARDLQRDIDNLKGAYDTSLLESIAEQKEGRVNIEALRRDIRSKTGALNALSARIGSLERKIDGNSLVVQLWDLLADLQPADRETLKSELRALYYWYPVKRLGMQMVFLLPLFAVFAVWNGASIRKSRGIQTLVSSHLLVVSFIPIFFKIIEAVYDIIPKKLLKKFLTLLESLKLVALWNYLVIAVAVAASLFLIYLFQKKLFSRDRLMERRIAKDLCQQCGKRLPPASQACPFCGFVQVKPCGTCSQPTPVYGKFCKACGKPQ